MMCGIISTKFIFEITRHLEKPVGMEMSTMFHHWCHYHSRWQVWDTPRRGFKKFIDIHTSSIKTNEREHGWWRRDTSLINRLAPLENGSLFSPFQLGWWLNFTWDPPQTDPTFVDDIEYLGCKMIGNNAGLALLGEVDEKEIKEKPAFTRLNPIIRQYEKLRHQNYFNDSVKASSRQPRKEFTLFQQVDGKWNFKPITCHKQKIAGINHSSSNWIIDNEYHAQPVRLRIELLMSAGPRDNPEHIVLEDFSRLGNFKNKVSAPGVEGEIVNLKNESFNNENTVSFSAGSIGLSPQKGSWIMLEKMYDPWLDLENNQALGVWVKGDGNGQLLNFRLETPEQFSTGVRGDYFVKVDFTGWRYFELVETESAEFTNYLWPGLEISPDSKVKDLFVYRSYLHSVQFDKVDKLQVWYNNLPKDRWVNCLIGPIRALPVVSTTVENPSVTVNNNKIIFPVQMESRMYVEFNSVSDCKLYGAKGEFIKKIKIRGNIPVLKEGRNDLVFSREGKEEVNSRMQVTIINEGDPLINY